MDELSQCSLLATACGLGSTTIEITERVFDVLAGLAIVLRKS